MRKLGIVLIVMMAVALFTAPVAMADPSNQTDTYRTEENHDPHGMTDWILQFDKKIWAGVNLAGDDAYGFYTQTNPGFNGTNGLGLIGIQTALPLGAPSYTSPCPTFVDTNSHFVGGGCEANVDSDEPQTAPLSTEWEIPILDDMLAKMWDVTNANNYLTQQLDILFFLDPKNTQQGFIDQTLDQDLADITGDASSYMTDGVGITQRLVSIFDLLGDASKLNPGQIGGPGGLGNDEYIDQWLVSYTKDVVAGNGIVSSYSQWFELDKDPHSCPDCTYTYSPGHDPINKSSAEIDAHP